jgi:hypothetical protein
MLEGTRDVNEQGGQTPVSNVRELRPRAEQTQPQRSERPSAGDADWLSQILIEGTRDETATEQMFEFGLRFDTEHVPDADASVVPGGVDLRRNPTPERESPGKRRAGTRAASPQGPAIERAPVSRPPDELDARNDPALARATRNSRRRPRPRVLFRLALVVGLLFVGAVAAIVLPDSTGTDPQQHSAVSQNAASTPNAAKSTKQKTTARKTPATSRGLRTAHRARVSHQPTETVVSRSTDRFTTATTTARITTPSALARTSTPTAESRREDPRGTSHQTSGTRHSSTSAERPRSSKTAASDEHTSRASDSGGTLPSPKQALLAP